MDNIKKFEDFLDRMQGLLDNAKKQGHIIVRVEDIENTFPELKEFEDERMRKEIIQTLKRYAKCVEDGHDAPSAKDFVIREVESQITWLEKQGEQKNYSWKPTEEQFEALDYAYNSCPDTEKGNYYEGVLETLIEDLHRLEKQGETFTKKDVDDAYLKGVSDTKNEIEKQYEANYQIRKDIATFIFNYRGDLKNRAKWMDYLGIKAYFVQKQDKQNPQPTLTLKSAIEAAKEEKVDNQNCGKPAEPKFHESDFIVGPYCRGKVIALTADAYLLDTGQGIPFSCEDNVHRWTIEDAKDGDVLIASDESIFIYAGSTDRHAKFYLALTKCGKLNVDGGNWEDKNSVHPATKEQRDVLFTKMKEAGYEWDAEKLELKKLDDEEVNGEDYGIDGLWHAQRILEKTLGSVDGYQTDDGILDHKAAITAVKKLYEQKPTWSEEDEKISQWIIFDIEKLFSLDKKSSIISNIEIDWLKSLKERIGE